MPRVASARPGRPGGVIWALHELQRVQVVELRQEWSDVAAGLAEAHRAGTRLSLTPLPDPVPSLWMGEAGIFRRAHALSCRVAEQRLLEAVHAISRSHAGVDVGIPWNDAGGPGDASRGPADAHRLPAWNASVDRLWEEWRMTILWREDLYGSRPHPRPGAWVRRQRVRGLAEATCSTRFDAASPSDAQCGRRSSTPKAFRRPRPVACVAGADSRNARTQWCHAGSGHRRLPAGLRRPTTRSATSRLGRRVNGGRGPRRKAPTSPRHRRGTGYAFLKLFERTGDDLWLERARAFAMHAVGQVERATARYGRGRHTLWTGDPGTALYLHSCLTATSTFPTLDYF